MAKIATLKLTFIYKNTKITDLEKHVCQNAVAMIKLSSRHNNLLFQIISRNMLDKVARFGSVWINIKTSYRRSKSTRVLSASPSHKWSG